MADCENKKLGNTNVTCIAPNFQSITRNTISYAKNIDATIKFGYRLEGEMKHQCDESLKRFQEVANITGKLETCLTKISTDSLVFLEHELGNMQPYYYQTDENSTQ